MDSNTEGDAEKSAPKPLKAGFVLNKNSIIAIFLFSVDVGLMIGSIVWIAMINPECAGHGTGHKDHNHDKLHPPFGVDATHEDRSLMGGLRGRLSARNNVPFGLFQPQEEFLDDVNKKFPHLSTIKKETKRDNRNANKDYEYQSDRYDPYDYYGYDFGYFNSYYDDYFDDLHDNSYNDHYYDKFEDSQYKDFYNIDYNDPDHLQPRAPSISQPVNSSKKNADDEWWYKQGNSGLNAPHGPSGSSPTNPPGSDWSWPDSFYPSSDKKSNKWPQYAPDESSWSDWYWSNPDTTPWKPLLPNTASASSTTRSNSWPLATSTSAPQDHGSNVNWPSPDEYTYGSAPAPGSPHGRDTTLRDTDHFPNSSFECGVQQIKPQLQSGRIVGGKESIPHSWPWIVGLIKNVGINKDFWFPICSGTIVTPRHVITAYHCRDETTSLKDFITKHAVTIGQHDKTNSPGQRYLLGDVRVHPQATGVSPFLYDIMLLSLKKLTTFNDKVQPVCLPKNEQELKTGTICWTYGWGNQGLDGSKGPSTVLQQVDLRVVSHKTCKESHPFMADYIRKEIFVCAGTRHGKDACQRDSGGPLTCKENGKWILHGVTSWGKGCGRGFPGGYAAVSFSMNWLCCFFNDIPSCKGIACDAEKYKFP